MNHSATVKSLLNQKKSGRKVLGCFPLYPPLELFASMGMLPVVLWDLKTSVQDLSDSDKHVQNYACGIARELVQFVLSETGDLLDGIFSYNACDTLRNLPEILADENSGNHHPITMLRMHVPQVNPSQTDPEPYLRNEIADLINAAEEAFDVTFSSEKFVRTAEEYAKMRMLCMEAEGLVARGALSFGPFCKAVLSGYFLPVEEQIQSLTRLTTNTSTKKTGKGKPILISGIMPPPPLVIKAIEKSGLRVAGNDIASMRRSYAYSPSAVEDPGTFYTDFFLNRFPCTTLLYKSDERLDAVYKMIEQSGVRGVIFSGEKFCEYEYFEFPYLEKQLREKDIPTLFMEFSVDDTDNIGAYATRVEAFAEMLGE